MARQSTRDGDTPRTVGGFGGIALSFALDHWHAPDWLVALAAIVGICLLTWEAAAEARRMLSRRVVTERMKMAVVVLLVIGCLSLGVAGLLYFTQTQAAEAPPPHAAAVAPPQAQNTPSTSVSGSGNALSTGHGTAIGTYIGTQINNQPSPPEKSNHTLTATISGIAKLIVEGQAVSDEWMAKDDLKLVERRYGEWRTKTMHYLSAHLDDSYAVQFDSAHGSAWMGSPAAHSIAGGAYWQEIKGKNEFLNSLISDLRKK